MDNKTPSNPSDTLWRLWLDQMLEAMKQILAPGIDDGSNKKDGNS